MVIDEHYLEAMLNAAELLIHPLGSFDEAIRVLRRTVPENGTNMLAAFEVASRLSPRPDNIIVFADGLPTMGAKRPWIKRVSSDKRRNLFNDAVRQLPSGVPVNIILLPMEGDPLAADAFWRLAKVSKGSFFSPARDWP